MDKYIGRLLDNRYEILEMIGNGGMAVVYKARCHRLNRLVAIKILKNDYLEDEDFRRRFHAESQAVAMLSHPNIVAVYDVSTSISLEADYIVMELIEGITLKQYMEKKGFLNWKETLHFAIQIAKALEHAHSKGIVHRDIKPHNVMVLKNGSVKVTDFGIARMMSKGNTLTKEALGSVHYISPEQAKGGRVDSRSDIYSLGVVMYEMMSGCPPYDGDSPVSVAIQHINGGAVMPSTLNPNIPGGLEQIIMKAMALDPNERYGSAAKMLVDMDDFRKDPAILFDYNTPPLDVVTTLPKPPLVLDTNQPRTTADRVASRSEGQRFQSGAVRSSSTGRNTGTVSRATGTTPRSTGSTPRNTGSTPRNTGATPKPTDRSQSRRSDDQRRRREEQERSRNRLAIIAIIACAVLAIVAILVVVILSVGGRKQEPSTLTVPELLGENYHTVDVSPDFRLILAEEVFDENTEAGTILKQEPEGGFVISVDETDRDIFITVSLGAEPKVGVMSDLTDYPLVFAQANLDKMEMDLQYEIVEEYHDTIEAGKVTRTEPAPDVTLEVGQTVKLYISLGKEVKTGAMPNVVDVSQSLAEDTLYRQELDLEVKVEEIFDSEIEKGNVVKTKPEKGDPLQTGQTVTIYISKGPELKEMPKLLGEDLDTAKSLLKYAGFGEPTVEEVFDEEAEEGTVLKQSHEEGKQVDITETVTLTVSKGPEPTEPPTEPEEVTMEQRISLRDKTADGPRYLTIYYNQDPIVEEVLIEQGVNEYVLPGVTGAGIEFYTVILLDKETGNEESWTAEWDFTG